MRMDTLWATCSVCHAILAKMVIVGSKIWVYSSGPFRDGVRKKGDDLDKDNLNHGKGRGNCLL